MAGLLTSGLEELVGMSAGVGMGRQEEPGTDVGLGPGGIGGPDRDGRGRGRGRGLAERCGLVWAEARLCCVLSPLIFMGSLRAVGSYGCPDRLKFSA
jgi:hypothetical protein